MNKLEQVDTQHYWWRYEYMDCVVPEGKHFIEVIITPISTKTEGEEKPHNFISQEFKNECEGIEDLKDSYVWSSDKWRKEFIKERKRREKAETEYQYWTGCSRRLGDKVDELESEVKELEKKLEEYKEKARKYD